MKNLTIIAAVGKNFELGKNNELIWHFKEDMNFFKENTINKPIVMGMNTLMSLPKILPNRTHIVLTTKTFEYLDKSIIVIHTIDELLVYLKQYECEVMVIGGASIYNQLLDYSNKLLLTEIDATADAYFPMFDKNEWNSKLLGEYEEKSIKYKRLKYIRKN